MRSPRSKLWIAVVIVVTSLIILTGITWGNIKYTRQNPGGNDFLVHWMGARALLEDGISPYSDETALRIQNFAYGHPAGPGEHELRVAYPLYSVIFFAPFALIKDFAIARAVWMSVLEAGLISMSFLCFRLFRWRPSPIVLGLLLLFSLFWYHGLRPLINGNAVILVALCITGGLLAMRAGADELAGVLFACSTIKPQVVVVFLAFTIFWCFFNRRWRVLGWFFGALFLLSTSAALFIPDWIMQNLREVMRYPGYNPPGTPGAAFAAWWPAFGQRLGLALTIFMAVIIILEWWASRKAEVNGFLWAAGVTLVASQWLGIQTDPGNYVILFPVLAMTLALLNEHWRKGGTVINVLILFLIFTGLWAIFLSTVQYGDQPLQSPVMFFPLPAMLFILLYWVRWWAVRPPRPWLDQIDL